MGNDQFTHSAKESLSVDLLSCNDPHLLNGVSVANAVHQKRMDVELLLYLLVLSDVRHQRRRIPGIGLIPPLPTSFRSSCLSPVSLGASHRHAPSRASFDWRCCIFLLISSHFLS